jgi:hypothetical protein
MYRAPTTIKSQAPLEGNDVYARLNWLLEVNTREQLRRRRFRSAREEYELQLMRRPLDSKRAFAVLGAMLGLLPPAAIFIKMFGYGLGGSGGGALLFFVCLLMNLTCAGMGYLMGSALAKPLEQLGRETWTKMLLGVPCLGAAWGAVTGFMGGLIFFGFGAVFGSVFAIPVGALAFTLFAVLHRVVARGAMIDARHFWPLACGTTLVASALILGL